MAKKRRKVGKAGDPATRLFNIGCGVLLGLISNHGINAVTGKMTDPEKQKNLNTILVGGKAASGVAAALMSKDQTIADLGIGVGAVGIAELGIRLDPGHKIFPAIAGLDFVAGLGGYGPDGGVYQTIGSSRYIPMNRGKTLLERPEETHGVYGTVGKMGAGDMM